MPGKDKTIDTSVWMKTHEASTLPKELKATKKCWAGERVFPWKSTSVGYLITNSAENT